MKKLLLFNLLLFSGLFNTFTMEQQQQEISSKQEASESIDLSQSPKDLWAIFAPYGVRKDKQTEKEIFFELILDDARTIANKSNFFT